MRGSTRQHLLEVLGMSVQSVDPELMVRVLRTSDLQKSRHLQKSRVTSGHKTKIEVAPGAKKGASRLFGPGGASSTCALCPDCAAP